MRAATADDEQAASIPSPIHQRIRAVRLLCLTATSTALIAGVSIGILTGSAPFGGVVRVVALVGAVGFGWCSISLLCAAVVTASSVRRCDRATGGRTGTENNHYDG